MSIEHTDVEKDQEELSAGFSSQDGIEKQQVSPVEPFPQPPSRPPRSVRDRWFVGITIAVPLVLVVSLGIVVLAQLGKQPDSQVKPTPTAPAATATSLAGTTTITPTPGIVLGPQACPAGRPTGWRSSSHTPMVGLRRPSK